MELDNEKSIVIYFSRKGQNYSKGKIIDLPVGNTEVIGKMIANLVNADIFQIESVNEYPKDYNECVSIAKSEFNSDSRPQLANDINIEGYSVIFLGYPNWCGTMPMAVWTFLERHDFSGKVIVPFCTHEGSGMGNSERDLKKLCPSSEVKKGIAIYGSSVNEARPNVEKWLKLIN